MPTVGDVLQEHGYGTTLIGKAHFQPLAPQPGSESIECQPILRDLDFWRGFHGPWYGFDHVETARMHAYESHVGQHYAIWMEEKGLHELARLLPAVAARPGRQVPWPAVHARRRRPGTCPRSCTTRTGSASARSPTWSASVQEDKPFFLWASFFDPHPPYVMPEPWASMYDPADMVPGRYVEGEFDDMPPQFAKTQEEHPDFYACTARRAARACTAFSSHLHTTRSCGRAWPATMA